MAQSHQSQKKLQHCKLQKDYKRFSTDSRWSSKSVMESASLYRALLGHLELVQWLLPLNPTIRLLWVSLLKSVRSKSISWISSIDLEQPKKRRILTPARGPWILTSLEVCRFPQGWKNFLIDLFISIWDNFPPAMLNLDYQGSDQFSLRIQLQVQPKCYFIGKQAHSIQRQCTCHFMQPLLWHTQPLWELKWNASTSLKVWSLCSVYLFLFILFCMDLENVYGVN